MAGVGCLGKKKKITRRKKDGEREEGKRGETARGEGEGKGRPSPPSLPPPNTKLKVLALLLTSFLRGAVIAMPERLSSQSMISWSYHVPRFPCSRCSVVLLLALPWGGMGSALTSPQESEIYCGGMSLSEKGHLVQGLSGSGPGVPLLCNTRLCCGAAERSDITSGARVSQGGGWGGFPLGTAGPSTDSLGSASAVAAAQQGTRAKILCTLPTESCHWAKTFCSEGFQRT